MTRCARNLIDGRGPDRIVNGMEIMLHAPARQRRRAGGPARCRSDRGVSCAAERQPASRSSHGSRPGLARHAHDRFDAPFWYPDLSPRSLPMTKDEVAAALDEIGTLLELKGENAFRANAYHNARPHHPPARRRPQADSSPRSSSARSAASATPFSEKITTLVTTGQLPYLDDLRASIPAGLVEMLRLPGLGPKKVKALHDELGDRHARQAEGGVRGGRGRQAEGLRRQDAGEDPRRDRLPRSRSASASASTRRCRSAWRSSSRFAQLPGVIRAELCGSLRRRRETVKDIDILVSATDAAADHGRVRQASRR